MDWQEFFNVKPVTSTQVGVIGSLLKTANLTHQELEEFREPYVYDGMTEEEGYELIEYLGKNQIDKVESGFNYSQTDIKRKLGQWK